MYLHHVRFQPEISRESIDEHADRVRFKRTPIMSTYVLAYVIGDFDYVEARDSDGVLIRVYTPVGKSHQGKFALDIAVKTLPFYHKYFNIAYPLPKMDLIAIPDFAAGEFCYILFKIFEQNFNLLLHWKCTVVHFKRIIIQKFDCCPVFEPQFFECLRKSKNVNVCYYC